MVSTLGRNAHNNRHILDAVIGVWFHANRTFYVQRSDKMKNYPGAWSLFSIQFTPDELRDSTDLGAAQRLVERMSHERLNGAEIQVRQFLTASTCTKNPINMIVNLRLYRVELEREPILNPEYYAGGAWMTAEEYTTRRGNATCGSCLRMWFDYCDRRGLIDARLSTRA